MSSLEVALFVLESWAEAGTSLRAYRVFGDAVFPGDLKVIALDRTAEEVSILLDGQPKIWALSHAAFKYVEEDGALPESVARHFAGRFLEIELPDDDLIIVGELSN
jgi:hypothetical protein